MSLNNSKNQSQKKLLIDPQTTKILQIQNNPNEPNVFEKNDSDKLLSSTKESEFNLNSPDNANLLNQKHVESLRNEQFKIETTIKVSETENKANKEEETIFAEVQNLEWGNSEDFAKETELGDFLSTFGPAFKNKRRPMRKSDWKIHKDMEIPLGELYRNQELTIISEEVSKAFTDRNSYVKREDLSRQMNTPSKIRPNWDSEFNEFGKQDFNSIISDLNMKNGEIWNQEIEVNLIQSDLSKHEIKNQQNLSNQTEQNWKERNCQSEIHQMKEELSRPQNRKKKLKAKSEIRIKNYPWKKVFEASSTYTSKKIVQKSNVHLKRPMRFSSNGSKRKKWAQSKQRMQNEMDTQKKVLTKQRKSKLECLRINLEKEIYVINMRNLSQKKVGLNQVIIGNAIFFKLDCGLLYEGNLKNGKLEGDGKLWKIWVRMGTQGKQENKEVLVYSGEFTGGNLQGTGVLYFENLWRYEGGFKESLAHGFGRLFDRFNCVRKEGLWMNGMFRG